MGHRALVAYRRPDGRFRLHYAHWGTDLGRRIGPETPLGGPAVGPSPPDRPATAVDPHPLARGLDAEAVLAAVDATVESLVAVTSAYRTATALVCPVGFPAPGGDPGPGDGTALPAEYRLVRPAEDPATLRDSVVAHRSRLWAAVEDGALPPAAATAALVAALGERGTVYAADDPGVLAVDDGR